MNKVINYISYQSFPAETANSLQTISNLKYLKKMIMKLGCFFHSGKIIAPMISKLYKNIIY